MEKKASIPVSLPRDNPTISYWQDPPDDIADLRSTPQLPDSADVAIIGSGVTGASIAYNILSRAPSTKIVMLEARQACSGATGRNAGLSSLKFGTDVDVTNIARISGGHTKPASYTTFTTNVESLGVSEAVKIARLEYNTMKEIHAFAKTHHISCDSSPMDTVDVIYDQGAWDAALRAIELMRKHMPGDPAAEYKILSSDETEKRLLCKGALGAIMYEAGSVSAYKFVIGVLKLDLAMGLNLQTGTPVSRLRRDGAKGWTLTTPRGNLRASKVILATNGYTAAVYPKLQGTIVPLRGQIAAHRLGSKMPKTSLPTTYSFYYDRGFDYMIQRPAGSRFAGDIIIGGGLVKDTDDGLEHYGTTDDSVCVPFLSKYLAASTETFFGENWGEDDVAGRIRKEWTGIMGCSADGYPLIGEIPDESGLYISASFQGHGMVLCFLCARALTGMLFGDDEKELYSWFPRAYKVTPARTKLKLKKRITDHSPRPKL